MTPNNFIAKAEVSIQGSLDLVWDALINPETIKKYMFGTTVVSDWREGGNIIWKGEWKGKQYEDKGVILQLKPKKLLKYTHFSPLTGLRDVPENYHTVRIELTKLGKFVHVTLSQDNNATEEAREHSEQNWNMMLKGLKELLESAKVQSVK